VLPSSSSAILILVLMAISRYKSVEMTILQSRVKFKKPNCLAWSVLWSAVLLKDKTGPEILCGNSHGARSTSRQYSSLNFTVLFHLSG